MKSIRLPFLLLAFITVFSLCQPLAASAADAGSFDPVPISITAEILGEVPVGSIVAWPVAINPADWSKWLECNGQAINATTYPELNALIGNKVPDLRGLFLRGFGTQSFSQNNGSTVGVTSTLHESGALKAVQGDAGRNITGYFPADIVWSHLFPYAGGAFYDAGGLERGDGGGTVPGLELRLYHFDTSRIVPTAGENRPANMAVRYLIRALK